MFIAFWSIHFLTAKSLELSPRNQFIVKYLLAVQYYTAQLQLIFASFILTNFFHPVTAQQDLENLDANSSDLNPAMSYFYSSVPNRRVGQNKRADQNKAVQGGIFSQN